MPSPRTYSPSFDTVTRAADAARSASEGVTVRFMLADLGSIEACRFAARSFQKSFTALRARANRLASTDTRDTNKTGPYASIVCQLQPLAEDAGWIVSLIPSRIVMANLDIIDNATGKPLEEFGRLQDDRLRLTEKAINNPEAFTSDDWDELTIKDRVWCRMHAPKQEPWHTQDGRQWFGRPGGGHIDPTIMERRAYDTPPPIQTTPTRDLADLAALPSVFGVDGGKDTQ